MQENKIFAENAANQITMSRDGDAVETRPSFGLLETLNHWIIMAMG